MFRRSIPLSETFVMSIYFSQLTGGLNIGCDYHKISPTAITKLFHRRDYSKFDTFKYSAG